MGTRAHVYKRRLLLLADFLDKLPRNRFAFGVWVDDDWKGATDLSCGASACALGWATTMPEFQRLGLRLVRPRDNVQQSYVTINNDYKPDASIRAAGKIFGLTYGEVVHLFYPHFNVYTTDPGIDATPKQVAAHIRKFVREKYGKKGKANDHRRIRKT